MTHDANGTVGRPAHPIRRTLLFSAGLLAAVRLAAACATTLDPLESSAYGRQDRERMAALLADPLPVEALVLGNSHAGAIDAATLGASAQVLNRGGGDLFEMRLYAAALLPRLPRLRRLYLTLSPFSLDWDNSADAAMKVRRVHAYAALPGWSFLPGDAFRFLMGKADPWIGVTQVLRGDSWKGVLLAALGRRPASAERQTLEGAAPAMAAEPCPLRSAADLDRHARRRAQEVAATVAAMAALQPDIRPRALRALETMIGQAQARGMAVTLVTPPYWRRYAADLARDMPKAAVDGAVAARRLAARLQVPYLDHSQDPRFIDDAAAFRDGDHLNACGAARFTRALLAEEAGRRPAPDR